jgi:hypothetical protein
MEPPPDPNELMAQIIMNTKVGRRAAAAVKVGNSGSKGKAQKKLGATKSRILEELAGEFNRLWAASKPHVANLPKEGIHTVIGSAQTAKNEQACWIIYNNKTDALRTVDFPGLGIRDESSDNFPNLYPNEKLVGWFHTHPNTGEEGYDRGPSDTDIAAAQTHKLVGLVRASTGGYQWFGTNLPD